jgi:hypothetical protein
MQRLTYKILLFIFLSTLSLITTYAAVLEEKTIYNFDQNWLKYDKYYEAYLPIQDKDLKNQKSLHQIINIEKYRNYKLKFKASKGLSFFINNKLIYKKITEGEEDVQIDLNKIESSENGEVIFTFYHSSGELPFYSTAIVYKAPAVYTLRSEENSYLVMSRNIQDHLSDYAILFIIIAALFVLFKQLYPKEFLRYYSFSFQEHSDHFLLGTFSIPSLWMALMNGLSLSLLIFMLHLNELFLSSLSVFRGTIFITSMYFLFFIMKYLYILVIAWLFNYSKVVSPQFSEYVRLFERITLVATVTIFGILASGFLKFDLNPEILYFSLIMVFIICVIKVIFLFFRLISHRNLYLFSYICAAEILPLIIAVKILLF